MSLKQDRTGTRTSEDLRRRLNVKGVDDAVKKIEINEQTVQDLSVNVFNLNKSLSNTRQTYVSTDNQTFTEEQKTRARNNIGAGISSFSGSYNDLSNKPNIPTKTSDLTNDRGFISDSNYVHTDNNFTDNEKTKLSGIEIGAEVNLIESISIDGVAQPISNKNANLSIPSQTVDASISDSSTNAVQNKVVKQYIDNVIETKEDTSNKITSWGTNEEAITDTQYPSAKLIFNTLENVVVSYAETSDIISLFSTGD